MGPQALNSGPVRPNCESLGSAEADDDDRGRRVTSHAQVDREVGCRYVSRDEVEKVELVESRESDRDMAVLVYAGDGNGTGGRLIEEVGDVKYIFAVVMRPGMVCRGLCSFDK